MMKSLGHVPVAFLGQVPLVLAGEGDFAFQSERQP